MSTLDVSQCIAQRSEYIKQALAAVSKEKTSRHLYRRPRAHKPRRHKRSANVWHNKRFVMEKLWGRVLAWAPNSAGWRFICKSVVSECVIHDLVYLECVIVQSPSSELLSRFGTGSSLIDLVHDANGSLVGPVNYVRIGSEVHAWVHTSIISTVCGLLELPAPTKELRCFEINGPKSKECLENVFGEVIDIPLPLQITRVEDIVLVARPTRGKSKPYWLIVPSRSARSLWEKLVLCKGRAIGLLDYRRVQLYFNNLPCFPQDYPDTHAGVQFDQWVEQRLVGEFRKRPKSKRKGTEELHRFRIDWNAFLEVPQVNVVRSKQAFRSSPSKAGALLRVKLVVSGKGSVREFSSIKLGDRLIGFITVGHYNYSKGHCMAYGFIISAEFSKNIGSPFLSSNLHKVKVEVYNVNSDYPIPCLLGVLWDSLLPREKA